MSHKNKQMKSTLYGYLLNNIHCQLYAIESKYEMMGKRKKDTLKTGYLFKNGLTGQTFGENHEDSVISTKGKRDTKNNILLRRI